MKKIKVGLGKRSYNIHIKRDLLRSVGSIIKDMGLANAAYVITNSKIRSLFGKILQKSLISSGLSVKFCVVPDSEKSKSHTTWIKVLKDVADFDKGKGVCIIALGGGVVGDLSGFVASSYRRGVPFIQVPTTLLAQVDSAIGGKAAIDIDCAKNIAGAFYQPKAVLSDLDTLKTLPARQIRNGLSEIIKYGIILDKRFFTYLEKNILKILKADTIALEYVVARCSRLKAEVVSADEEEKSGYRSILNFGHTIGHAIEVSASYKKSISHGEAVACGMLCAFDIAVALNITDKNTAARAEGLIEKSGLPTRIKGIAASSVIKATSYDKKIQKGEKRWVLPREIGHAIVCSSVPKEIIKRAVIKRIT
ncbi:MAG: 3-dehydroquinate synthase [Candidatus Omnitrophota bacterium]